MIAKEKSYVVYIHTAPNGKKYVGQTSKKPEARWRNGKGYEAHHPHFYFAIKKYGWDNFTHEIVAKELTKKEADRIEADLIKKYNCTDREYGYNVASCACGNGKHSDETKRKISVALKGHKVSQATRRKLSIALAGRKPPPKSEAGLKAIIEYNTGKCVSAETRERLRVSHLGYKMSKETKEKLSKILKGRKIESMRIAVLQKDKETGTLIAKYDSLGDAMQHTGVPTANISAVCKGKRKTAGGYKWEYLGGGRHHK